MGRRVGASIQGIDGRPGVQGRESPIQMAEREAHDVGIASLDALHWIEVGMLDRIGSGLVHRITAGSVGTDLSIRVGAHPDWSFYGLLDHSIVPYIQDSQAAVDQVLPASQLGQQLHSVSCIPGFAQHFSVESHQCIRCDDDLWPAAVGRGNRLAEAEPAYQHGRRRGVTVGLVHIRTTHLKTQAEFR